MTKEDFIKHANKYLGLGFSIIPVGQDKKPLLRWEEYQKRKATQEEIEKWASKYKNPNIGIVTGSISGITVVDVEAGGPTDNLPPTVLVRTGGGGFHFYYKYSQPIKNSVRIRDKTDIRGAGGYVIAPPSLHKSGNYYEWVRSPEDSEFKELPGWILSPNKASHNQVQKIDWQKFISKDNPEGIRNLSAAQLIGKLCHHLPQELWESSAWPAFKEWNLIKNKPPLLERELRATFESILKKERAKKKSTETETTPELDPELVESVRLDDVLASVETILPGKKELVLLALATSISHYIDSKTPLWLMFVGVPSSAKTEVARLVALSPHVYLLDALTENAFISGAKNKNGDNPIDLLPLLNGKCFLIKDFTTTLSQREESVRKILGDLTSIYDNSFSKHSGFRGTVRYFSFFSILGCVTPQALNRHQRYMNQIGPRFLFYRVPRSSESEVEQGLGVLWSNKDSKTIYEEVQQKVSAYSYQLSQKLADFKLKDETLEVQDYLNRLAKFIARARGSVLTRQAEFLNSENEKVSFYEPIEIQIEEPFRALLQLRVIARSLAIVSGRESVTGEDLELVRRVALSSMPADRSLLLSVVATEDKSWSAKDIADNLGISHKTALRQLDELVSLKILDKTSQGGGLANLYSLNVTFRSVVYITVEFMSHPQPTETQTPQEGIENQINAIPGLEDYTNE